MQVSKIQLSEIIGTLNDFEIDFDEYDYDEEGNRFKLFNKDEIQVNCNIPETFVECSILARWHENKETLDVVCINVTEIYYKGCYFTANNIQLSQLSKQVKQILY